MILNAGIWRCDLAAVVTCPVIRTGRAQCRRHHSTCTPEVTLLSSGNLALYVYKRTRGRTVRAAAWEWDVKIRRRKCTARNFYNSTSYPFASLCVISVMKRQREEISPETDVGQGRPGGKYRAVTHDGSCGRTRRSEPMYRVDYYNFVTVQRYLRSTIVVCSVYIQYICVYVLRRMCIWVYIILYIDR